MKDEEILQNAERAIEKNNLQHQQSVKNLIGKRETSSTSIKKPRLSEKGTADVYTRRMEFFEKKLKITKVINPQFLHFTRKASQFKKLSQVLKKEEPEARKRCNAAESQRLMALPFKGLLKKDAIQLTGMFYLFSDSIFFFEEYNPKKMVHFDSASLSGVELELFMAKITQGQDSYLIRPGSRRKKLFLIAIKEIVTGEPEDVEDSKLSADSRELGTPSVPISESSVSLQEHLEKIEGAEDESEDEDNYILKEQVCVLHESELGKTARIQLSEGISFLQFPLFGYF